MEKQYIKSERVVEILDARYLYHQENAFPTVHPLGLHNLSCTVEGMNRLEIPLFSVRSGGERSRSDERFIFMPFADKSGQVVYFDYLRGRQETMRAGKFAKRFFCERDRSPLSDESARKFADEVKCDSQRYELFKVDTDPGVWKYVYENGPESCMSNAYLVEVEANACPVGVDQNRKTMLIHPTYVYCTGDFELWYIRDQKQGGEIVSRCIVSTINNSRSVIYGYEAPLLQYLKDHVFEPGSFRNHTLFRIPALGFDDAVVMSYMDDDVGVTEHATDGDKLVLCLPEEGIFECDRTDGVGKMYKNYRGLTI